MLRSKIEAPPLPVCVDRPRLLRTVLSVPTVALAAPAGHGKTCLAAQIAAATGGPSAWFVADELDRDQAAVVAGLLSALAAGWTDLGLSTTWRPGEDAATAVLGATLETLAGPGCLVVDDAHLLDRDVLDAVLRTALANLPPECRLVVCTRAGVPTPLVRAEAMGLAVALGATDLTFDVDECRRVCGSAPNGDELFDRTGGWPLAVALAIRRDAGQIGPSAARARHISVLADIALESLDEDGRQLLVAVSRIPHFPERLLRRLGARSASLIAYALDHPELLSHDDGWWSPREWLRDVLRRIPADDRLMDEIVHTLHTLDELELAAQLLITEGRFERAVPLVERLAADGARQGRPAWVRALLGSIPAPLHSLALALQEAAALQALNLSVASGENAVSEQALLRLIGQAEAEGSTGGQLLQARALLANHYRMAADGRVLGLCEVALGDALRVEDPETALVGRWSPDDAVAAADMLRFYGAALLFASDRATVERGRRLVAAALAVLDGAGRPTLSQRAWAVYFEVLLFLRPASAALEPARAAAHRLANDDHNDAAVRLAEVATLEYFVGDHLAARRTIELARECGERTGNYIALPPLASIEIALDVAASSMAPHHAARFEATIEQLQADAKLAPFSALIAAEFGMLLVGRGRLDDARHYLSDAEALLGTTYFAHVTAFRCRRLRGLIMLAEGSADGETYLQALRDEAAGEGRDAVAEQIDGDLAAWKRGEIGGSSLQAEPPPPVVVHVLAPELTVAVRDERLPPPRGYPAKLLALLVAARGSMTIDAAIEGLWPGADPDIGRNRLHGVVLRLRRSLGLRAGGPLRVADGVVRIEPSPQLDIDSWEFEHLALAAARSPQHRSAALEAYGGDVLTHQFAYDDTVASYRAELRRTFLRIAMSVLDDPPDDLDAEDVARLARRAWRAAPDDERVTLATVEALSRLGHVSEAREMMDVTAAALDDLGLDGDGFRRQAPPVLTQAGGFIRDG